MLYDCGRGARAKGETRKIAAILVSDVVGYSRPSGPTRIARCRGFRGLRSEIAQTAAILGGISALFTNAGPIGEVRRLVAIV